MGIAPQLQYGASKNILLKEGEKNGSVLWKGR